MQIRKAVIPAAGLGTRFLPVTMSVPKELLPIIDRPLLQYVIAEAVEAGVEEVIIVTSPDKESIGEYFQSQQGLEQRLSSNGEDALLDKIKEAKNLAKVSFVMQHEALGLGHAVLMAKDAVGDEPFVVILPDDIIAHAPAKDKNLWRLRVALLALKQGRHAEARELFNAAMPSAGIILKGDAGTRKAQNLFSPEERKSFHGEPYERTMGWFYRGMLYWMDGEPDNARACFRTAQLMDALAEKNKFRADWVLLDYLDGMVTAKLGDDSSGALNRARIHAGDTTLPEYNTNANVMIFLQFGFGPVKKSGGDVGEKINYDGGFSATKSARIRVESQIITVPIFDDLTYQANTRGRRAMDSILTRKARVKKAADGIGDVGIVSGAKIGRAHV